MYKLKKYSLYIIVFLGVSLLMGQKSFAANIEDRSYIYVQAGMGVDAYSKLFISLRSYDSEKKEWQTTDYNLNGYGDINPVISFGYYINSYGLAVEVEYGRHIVYEKNINGKETGKEVDDKAYSSMNYFLINFRKNLFTMFSPNNIVYIKLGAGAGMVNNIVLGQSSAMNVPTPVVQGGIGFIRQINNYIDIDLEYRYKANISKRAEVTNGIKQIYQLQAHSIVASVRFKI